MEEKFVQKYYTFYGFSSRELFTRFKHYYIKDSQKKIFKVDRKRYAAARIFVHFFWMVLKDVIDNNVTFKLPTGFESYIEMGVISGENFIKARQNGAFPEVDFLASNFTAYRLQYRYKLKSGIWMTKHIYVHRKLKDIITENTNNRVRY